MAAGSYGASEGAVMDPADHTGWLTTAWIRVVTSVTAVADGYEVGIIGVALVSMKEALGLAPWEVALIVTALGVGAFVGALIAGQSADENGRIPTMLFANIMLVLGSIVIVSTTRVELIVLGRALAGLGVGSGLAVVSVYLTEVAPRQARGVAVATEDVFVNVGIFLGFVMGRLLFGVTWQGLADWQLMFLVGALLPAVTFVVLCFGVIPESPRYFMLTDRPEEAERVLLLVCTREEAAEVMRAARASQQEIVSWGEVAWSSETRRRRMLLAACVVATASSLSGVNALTTYGVTLLSNLMPVRDAASIYVVLALVKLVATAAGCFLMVWIFSRRQLLLGSYAVMAVAAAVLLHTFWLGEGLWSAVAIGVIYVAFGLGAGPLLFLYPPEVLDNAMRSKGNTIAFSACRIVNLIWLASFPFMDLLTALAVLVVTNLVCVLGVYLFAPETKDVLLEANSKIFEETKP